MTSVRRKRQSGNMASKTKNKRRRCDAVKQRKHIADLLLARYDNHEQPVAPIMTTTSHTTATGDSQPKKQKKPTADVVTSATSAVWQQHLANMEARCTSTTNSLQSEIKSMTLIGEEMSRRLQDETDRRQELERQLKNAGDVAKHDSRVVHMVKESLNKFQQKQQQQLQIMQRALLGMPSEGSKVSTLKRQLQEAKTKLAAAESSVATLRNMNSNLTNKVEDIAMKRVMADREVEKRQHIIDKLEHQVRANADVIAKQRADLADFHTRTSRQCAESKMIKRKNASLTATVANLRSLLDRSQVDVPQGDMATGVHIGQWPPHRARDVKFDDETPDLQPDAESGTFKEQSVSVTLQHLEPFIAALNQ